MKKNSLLALFLIICMAFVFTVCGCASVSENKSDFLRLHIRADSNEYADQQVKLKVRDEIVAYLTPRLSGAANAADAKRIIKSEIKNLEAIGDGVLKSNGFSYGASARLTRENFPTRAYGDIVLESGEYDALIINLGSGKGDNWWCVAYPPLCFVGEESGDETEYKSLIKEIIEKWRKNAGKNN